MYLPRLLNGAEMLDLPLIMEPLTDRTLDESGLARGSERESLEDRFSLGHLL